MNNQSGKIPNQTKFLLALLPKSTTDPSNSAQVGSTPSRCPICSFY